MPENNGGYRDDKGKFAPGNPGKPKGAASNASAKVKEAIVNFLENNVEKIQDSFDKLKDREKLQFIADILPYATPKLSSIQSENDTHLSGSITISWEEPELPNSQDQGSY